MNFTTLGLSPETLKAIAEVGYTTPTPIQAQAIPVVFMGKDVLGIAQTGTGKTASFTLPMIDILARGRARARMPRSLILTPTRELAAQVAENFTHYGRYHKLSMVLLVGGEAFADQIRLLDHGADVLIATPGRLLDLFQRGRVLLSDVRILVIDEADRMLDMGFIPDVERIVTLLPRQRQTLFFSATMQPEVKRLADAFLNDPREIHAALPAQPADGVRQGLIVVDFHDKREVLRHLLRKEQVRSAFIFCNRKRDIGVLHRSLVKHGFPAGMLHGDMPQSMRTETLEQFKAGEISLLVCSDVAARGIDVTAMSHVFNFDVPIHAEDYIHRIGRTGRAGMSGHAFTIAVPEDGSHVVAIEKLIGHAIPRVTVDSLDEVELVMERRKWQKDKAIERGYVRRWNECQNEQMERVARMEGHRNGSDRGWRRLLRDDGTGVAAMEHPDDVLGFGDHVPDFFLVDPLKNLEIALVPSLADEETNEQVKKDVEAGKVAGASLDLQEEGLTRVDSTDVNNVPTTGNTSTTTTAVVEKCAASAAEKDVPLAAGSEKDRGIRTEDMIEPSASFPCAGDSEATPKKRSRARKKVTEGDTSAVESVVKAGKSKAALRKAVATSALEPVKARTPRHRRKSAEETAAARERDSLSVTEADTIAVRLEEAAASPAAVEMATVDIPPSDALEISSSAESSVEEKPSSEGQSPSLRKSEVQGGNTPIVILKQ